MAYLLLLVKYWQYSQILKALERLCCQTEAWEAELLPTCVAQTLLQGLALMCDRSEVPQNQTKHTVCPLLISRQQRDLPCPSLRLYAVTSIHRGPCKITMRDLPACQSYLLHFLSHSILVSLGMPVSWSLIDCRGLNWKCECAHHSV